MKSHIYKYIWNLQKDTICNTHILTNSITPRYLCQQESMWQLNVAAGSAAKQPRSERAPVIWDATVLSISLSPSVFVGKQCWISCWWAEYELHAVDGLFEMSRQRKQSSSFSETDMHGVSGTSVCLSSSRLCLPACMGVCMSVCVLSNNYLLVEPAEICLLGERPIVTPLCSCAFHSCYSFTFIVFQFLSSISDLLTYLLQEKVWFPQTSIQV